MENASFTKGPWAMAPETNGTEIVAYSAAPWRVRAVIARGDFITCNPNWKNDTALWTAAPDLYEALKGIVDDDDAGVSLADQRARSDARMAAAKAALLKATGA